MKLQVIGTGSKGNCYLLESENETLIIECGVGLKGIKQSLKYNLSKVAGCLVTHEHKDHSKSIKEVLDAGIPVYATKGTHLASGTIKHHRAEILETDNKSLFIGSFKIMAFDVKHDASDPCGFLIEHGECGKVLFITDTFYCPYTFSGLNNIIIEANYSRKILGEKLYAMEFLKNRILKSHMSLETCISFLNANDLSAVNNIVLIHLSDNNSNEQEFKTQTQNATGKNVLVASNGMTIPFNKTPF